MALNWKSLEDIDQLNSIETDSLNSPIAIFKHSTTCSISMMAKKRLESTWNIDIDAYYLDLKKHRDISNEIADRYNVHHESPQIILIKNKEAVYDASHFDISVDELQEALSA
jgi:bacillithiol system protein YtxJ